MSTRWVIHHHVSVLGAVRYTTCTGCLLAQNDVSLGGACGFCGATSYCNIDDAVNSAACLAGAWGAGSIDKCPNPCSASGKILRTADDGSQSCVCSEQSYPTVSGACASCIEGMDCKASFAAGIQRLQVLCTAPVCSINAFPAKTTSIILRWHITGYVGGARMCHYFLGIGVPARRRWTFSSASLRRRVWAPPA